MIFDRFEWFPSTLPVTCWERMKEERKRMKALGGRGMYDASRRLLCEGWGGEVGSGSSISVGVDVGAEVEATGALRFLTSVLGEKENSVRNVKDIGWLGSAAPSGDGPEERSGGSSQEAVGMPCSYFVCVRIGGMWGPSDGETEGVQVPCKSSPLLAKVRGRKEQERVTSRSSSTMGCPFMIQRGHSIHIFPTREDEGYLPRLSPRFSPSPVPDGIKQGYDIQIHGT